MAGILFIIVVIVMAIGCVAILIHGRGMLFVDPQPSYYVVDEDDLTEADRYDKLVS